MTNEETIKIIEIAIAEVEWNYPMEYAEAFKLSISALEKQIPKKPIIGYDEQDYICCPNCNYELETMDAYDDYFDHYNYCPDCGQALKWGDTDD